ncbi:MAG: hypothetical protein ACYSUM_23920 [Planctomycetota bacterium]|jgi:hypothetical protein
MTTEQRVERLERENRWMRRISVFILLVALLSCNSASPVPPDDASVYRDFLAARFSSDEGHLVVMRFTKLDAMFYDKHGLRPAAEVWKYFDELEGLRKETYEDFYHRNKKPRDLTGKIESACLLLPEENEELYPDGMQLRWKKFHEMYPKAPGIIYLAVGFSPDGRQALLYCANQRGPLDGEGIYYLLKRTNRRWGITDEHESWIS